jgi:hypothetical protein
VSRRKRTPIGGVGRNISPRAVELWRQCCEMLQQGYDEDGRDFRDLALELHLELGLRPWHPHVIDVAADGEPPGYLHPSNRLDWLTVIEIRRRLEEVA